MVLGASFDPQEVLLVLQTRSVALLQEQSLVGKAGLPQGQIHSRHWAGMEGFLCVLS